MNPSAARVLENDLENRFDDAIWAELAATELFYHVVDEAHGGRGLDLRRFGDGLLAFLGRTPDLGVAVSGVAHAVFLRTVSEYGSEQLREAVLAPGMAGELIGALANSEPEAGTDIMSLRSEAVEVDAGR
ncbi:MAG: acyl-CoA dehydrogenase family protein [Myxococcota bacterium]